MRQLADRQLVLADIVQNQRLDVVDVANTEAVEPFDHLEELTMQAFNQPYRFKVLVLHGVHSFGFRLTRDHTINEFSPYQAAMVCREFLIIPSPCIILIIPGKIDPCLSFIQQTVKRCAAAPSGVAASTVCAAVWESLRSFSIIAAVNPGA